MGEQPQPWTSLEDPGMTSDDEGRPRSQLSFAILAPDERGANNSPLTPNGVVLADELDRIAARLRGRGGVG